MGYQGGMQNAARYREFAEILARAVQDTQGPARELMLELAQAWRTLAGDSETDCETDGAPSADIIDFASARRQRSD